MQAKAISERELVDICMKELCKKSGFTDCGNMVQRDLEFICDNIESTTGILISLSTIKRLFNGQFSRLPQTATLNAISQHLGYQNWQDYKQYKTAGTTTIITNGANGNARDRFPELPITDTRPAYTRWLLLTALLVCTGIGLFAMLKLGKPKAGNFEKASFSISRTTQGDLPNTVVFNYNLEEVNADSFFIQQSWDINRRVRIDKHSHTLTDIYYEPGYHIAKLIANDRVIKTLDVSIPTDRWFFYAKEKKAGALPQYINPVGPFKDGSLRLDKNDLTSSGIDVQKQHTYIQVYFPSVFKSSSDNFVLKTRARVNDINNSFCPYLMYEVFCQRNFTFFISSAKGCASEINAQFGENYLSGKTNDLSAFGSNVKDWQDIEFTIKNKQVSIKINNAQVYSGKYDQSSGLITGLGFISNGLPEVDFVSLQTLDGEDIYSADF